ncbi:MAG: hypothetical protein AAF959_20460 [Cyanobacteria bacterium P01_D01_bin.56]
MRNISGSTPQLNEDRFLSLSALRVEHSNLLQRYRKHDNRSAIFTEIEQFILKGTAIGEILDSEDERWAAQSLLDYWASILYRANREVDTTLISFDPSLAPELDDSLQPYLGLEAFREENKHLFFGRQRLLNRLIEKFKKNRLLTVVGSSGSGKSSVVLGGLIPKLKAGELPESKNWHYYEPMVPGSKPLVALANIIRPLDADANEWKEQQVNRFRTCSEHLSELVSNLNGQIPSVLVIDQFEELFTLCQDSEIRQAFVDNLLGLARLHDTRHTVIITMRSDFEDKIPKIRNFQEVFEETQVRIMPLTASEIRDAIEKPAEQVGLKFEDGLVEELLDDFVGEVSALPLLQFTLLKLWESRERNRVTRESYTRVGGGREALAKSADEFYTSLIYEEQQTAKKILLKMVRPGEGTEVTRNRILKREFYYSRDASDRIDRVLEKLHKARLIRYTEGDSPQDIQVEISHEALIRNWGRFVAWIDKKRQSLHQRRQFTDDVEKWLSHERKKDFLYRGEQIEEVREYEDLSTLEEEFISQSLAEEKRQRLTQRTLEQVVSNTGKFNLVVDKEVDLHVGDSYNSFGELTPEKIHLLVRELLQEVQSLHSISENSAENSIEYSETSINDLSLLDSTFKSDKIEAVSSKLELIQRVYNFIYNFGCITEASQLVLSNLIQDLKNINEKLQSIEERGDRLIQSAVVDMRQQLAGLKLGVKDLTAEIRTALSPEELEWRQTENQLLENFVSRLEDSRIGSTWIDRNIEVLKKYAYKQVLKEFPELDLPEDKANRFQLSLKQFLEQVSFCLYWGTYSILDSPDIPFELEIEHYETAFIAIRESIKRRTSSQLRIETIHAIEECFDYLIARLPFIDME